MKTSKMPSTPPSWTGHDYDDATAAEITSNDVNPQPQFQPHPLLMDHVVENILLSMDVDLLGHYCKIFRLVCKDWARPATHVYKTKRGCMTFKKNFVGKVCSLFIRVMRTSASIPFQSFKFCSDSYDDEHFTELLYVCGGSISTLDLNIVNPCALRFPKYFPNLVLGRLKKLIFHVRLDCYEVVQVEIASLLETLFQISPKLESLDLKVLRGVSRTAQNTQLSLTALLKLGDVLSSRLPDRVRELKLQITLTDGQLRELNQRTLNLRRLDLYLQQSQVTTGALEEFFAKVGPNLESCKVLGNQFINQIIKFPVFGRLQYLSALGRAPSYLHYSKLFPALKRLEICLWDSLDDIFPPNCYSPSLQHIKFPYQVGSAAIFQRMGTCFPNLKSLTEVTVTSAEAMISLFQSLKSLQRLEVCLGYDFQTSNPLDAIFSGMRPDAVPSANFKYNEDAVREDIGKNLKGVDSIRNLKELRYLSITAAPLTMASQAKISDISVYYGFLQLDKLAVIKLDYFPISNSCIETLRRNVQLLRPA